MSLTKEFTTRWGVVQATFHTIFTDIEGGQRQQWLNTVITDNRVQVAPSTFLKLDEEYTQEVADELAYRLTPEGKAAIAERVRIIKEGLLEHQRDKFEQLFDDSEDF